jgi:hyperosmotically inducible protein
MKRIRGIAVLALLLIVGLTLAPSQALGRAKDVSDTTIKSIVDHRLNDKGLQRNNNIQVVVDDQIVELNGTVRSLAEKRRAESIARGAAGVAKVENNLIVAANRESEQEIANDVGRAIRRSPNFDIYDWVEGQVRDGVVTLKGQVREPWRKNEYGRLAEAVEGVSQVNNEIEVLPTSIYDDQIRVAATRAIYGDPRFTRYAFRSLRPIHIIVNQGRVTLKGAVASQMDKQLAEMAVRTRVLSFEVSNELVVDNEKQG